MEGLSTGIEALDTLLFGDVLYRNGFGGLRAGEVILIRGEPGAGKTTLALQIVTNILRDVPSASAHFVTVEESPDAIKRKCEAYGFLAQRLHFLERETANGLIRPGSLAEASRPVRAVARFAAAAVATATASQSTQNSLAAAAAAAEALMIENGISRFLTACRVNGANGGRHSLLVIDSLNAFMNLLIAAYPGTQPRLLFNQFCHRLRQEANDDGLQPVIILTGEYHFQLPDSNKELPESFFCDTEIVLKTEAIRAPREHLHSDRIALGYDRTALVHPDARSLESRSFCRVLKARRNPNQSRRCAYDIESGTGIRFFETYPGDGTLLVFAENEKQREVWGAFQDRDIPDAYPALRYESFTMKGLQSVYDSTRRLHNVPLRTDMHLSTLDSYWVVGYRDYRFKKKINETLLRLIDANVDPISKAPRIEKATLARRGELAGDPEQRARSDAARVLYPRLVNDLLHYALLHLEQTLYSSTLEHLRQQDMEQSRQDRLTQQLNDLGTQLSQAGAEIVARYSEICRFLFDRSAQQIIDQAAQGMQLRDTFLRPLPRSKIVLYGQYNSNLLRSLRREDMHQVIAGEDHWLAVPYDANVGVFVVRTDLFAHALEELAAKVETRDQLCRTYRQLKSRELAVLRELAHILGVTPHLGLSLNAAEVDSVRSQLTEEIAACERAAKDAERYVLSLDLSVLDPGGTTRLTWDQVLCLSSVFDAPIGIETRIFDTLMAFFLELIGNCGGDLKVDARYRVHNVSAQIIPLTRALHYFSAIFELTRTPRTQTLDPSQYDGGEGEAGVDRRERGPQPYGSWLFSRFWYSTLVDALTAKHETGIGAGQHVWRKRDPKAACQALEIVKMPSGANGRACAHRTCWGEWNLALLAGSENVTLACDLVSNLMGALKVRERGLRGAALPTVRQFYEVYAQEPCIPIDLRDEITPPRMTFKQLRNSYLETAGSDTHTGRGALAIFRQAIFDYRHCAAEIHAGLLATRNQLTPGQMDPQLNRRLAERALHTIKRIQDLRDKYLFIGDSFRHDALQLSREHSIARPGS
jgi:KaiC/GvpD/RAD55 family RecA-like ATPase